MKVFRRIDKTGRIHPIEYVVVFLLLCISGNPLFVYADTKMLYVIFCAFTAVLCLTQKRNFADRRFLFFLAATVLLMGLQFLCLNIVSISADVNFIAKLCSAFFVALFCGNRFREVYFRVVAIICFVSLLFYALNCMNVFVGWRSDRYYTVGIYNSVVLSDLSKCRNSGMFWEPGAFQGYIMLIPLLFYDKLKSVFMSNPLSCFVILVSLLTTKSTTAYVALCFFLFMSILVELKVKMLLRIAMFAVAAFFVLLFVWEQDFMGEKIINDFQTYNDIQRGDVSWSRTGAMKISMYSIARHPFIGNGFSLEARYGINGESMAGAGNGLFSAVNIFGIPYMLLFFLMIYLNFLYMPVTKRIVTLLILAMLLFGECYLNYPLFWILAFVSVPKPKMKADVKKILECCSIEEYKSVIKTGL